MRKRIWPATLLAIAVALVATPALAQKQTVVVYTAIENEQITDYMKALNKTHPNLDVKILRLSTGDISARFMAEKDNMQADVIWGVGATNQLDLQERRPARALRAQGAGANPAAVPRQGQPAVLGGHRHLHVGLLLQHRRRRRRTTCPSRSPGPTSPSPSTRATW